MEGNACHRRAGLVDVLVKSLRPRLRIFPLSESFLQRLYGRGNDCAWRTHSHNCSDKPGQWAFYLIIGALVIIGVLVAGADEAPPRSGAVGLLIGGAAGLENKWGASIAVLPA